MKTSKEVIPKIKITVQKPTTVNSQKLVTTKFHYNDIY